MLLPCTGLGVGSGNWPSTVFVAMPSVQLSTVPSATARTGLPQMRQCSFFVPSFPGSFSDQLPEAKPSQPMSCAKICVPDAPPFAQWSAEAFMYSPSRRSKDENGKRNPPLPFGLENATRSSVLVAGEVNPVQVRLALT